MSPPDPREWLYLRIALGAVALIAVLDLTAWKVHELRNPPTTRLDSTVNCFIQRGGVPVVPAGDPLSATAGAGSLRVTVEGNGVTVALASSVEEAIKIFRGYRAVGGDLAGRLERRGRTVYLWEHSASPTQRQVLYDCQY